ncbi:Ig-like domain-containing protein [Kistimonas scapharcae]|uniref:Ig-like domain-containing protein n=1 Tax=Kistimonas scapharcae TaxID=1036133 RepID=UPI0031EA2DD0
MTITGTNDAPVAVVDSDTTSVGSTLLMDVLANDTDVDSDDNSSNFSLDNVNITGITDSEGSRTINGGTVSIENNQLKFVPGSDFDYLAVGESATVTVSYTMSDDSGETSTATATITVSGTNSTPVAQAVNVGATEDGTAISGNFAVTDDNTTDTHTFTILTQPDEGSVTNNNDGTFSFNPGSDFQDLAAGETRQVTFTYEAVDDSGAANATSEAATVTITITGTNDKPTAAVESISATEDGAAVTGNFGATDADTTDTHTFNILTQPDEGSVTNNGDGTFSFNPGSDFQDLAAGETRQVTFTYEAVDDSGTANDTSEPATVTITITGTNDKPTAEVESISATEDGAAVTGNFGATDADTTDTHTFNILTQPDEGSVTNNNDGTFSFNPGSDFQDLAAGETRQVTFTYEAVDDSGTANDTSGPATVTITITGTNDKPTAAVESISATEDGAAVTGNFGATDADTTDTHTFNILTQPDEGSVTNNGDGTFSFNPGSDFQDLAAGETRQVTFTYEAVDDSGTANDTSEPATVTITITGNNDAPVAVVDAESTAANATLTVDVLANDTDVDSSDSSANFSLDNVSITGITDSAGTRTTAGGSVSIVGNQLQFNPGSDFSYLAAGESATVTVSYTMSDDEGLESTATATITVNGVNDAPVLETLLDPEVNTETRVNSTVTTGNQDAAHSDSTQDGSITVWYSEEGGSHVIRARLQDGSEIQVNETAPSSDQYLGKPEIAVLDNGNFAVTWDLSKSMTYNRAHMRVFDQNGTEIQSEFTLGGDHQYLTKLVALSGNQFATAYYDAADGFNVHVKIYDASGTETSDIVVGSVDGWGNGAQDIVALDNGGFAVTWRGTGTGSDSASFRIYDASGNSVAGPVSYGGAAPADDKTVDIEVLDSGELLTAYQSGDDLYVQRWTSTGTASGSPVRINTTTDGTQADVTIEPLADGSFFVIWRSDGQDGDGQGIYGRHFDATGNALTDEIQINTTTTGNQSDPEVTQLAGGELLITWTSDHGTDNDVYSTTLDLSGNRVSEGASNGTVVGKAVATDIDTGDTLTYSLVDDAGGRFAIDGNTGTITVANSSLLDFETATSHTVRVRVVDAGGLSSEQDIAISVVNANEAPTSSDNTVTLDEDASHTFTATEFGFSDVDAGDSLSSITITQLPATGSLTLNGVDVTANQVISAADIPNLAFTPAAHASGTGAASLQFTVSDGELSSSVQTLTFNISAVVDAPTVAVSNDVYSDLTLDTELISNGGFNTSNGWNLSGSSTVISDSLVFSAAEAPVNGVAEQTFTIHPDVNYSLNLDYRSWNTNPVAGRIEVIDSATGTVLATQDVDTNSSNYQQLNLSFTGIASGNAILRITDTSGTTVSSDLVFDNISIQAVSADNTHIPTGIGVYGQEDQTIAVGLNVATPDTDGSETLAIELSGIPSGVVLSDGTNTLTSTGAALDVSGWNLGNLTVTPTTNNHDDFTFTVTATATESSTGDTNVTTQAINVHIAAVNDAPTASDNTVTLNEDGSHTFAASEFGFNDIDAGDTLSSVRITQLPGAGSLMLNGTAVTANQVIAAADISNLVFSPEANANGNDYASFQFSVTDSGGLESAAQTMTLDVTAVNDAPTIAGMTETFDSSDGWAVDGTASITGGQAVLTTNGLSQAGAVLWDTSIASSGGLHTTFDFKADGTADGLALVLVDGDQVDSSNFAVGGHGGGLGVNGMENEYLAIGFDEYSNDQVHLINSSSTEFHSVSVAGYGGINGTTFRKVDVELTPDQHLTVKMSWDNGVTWQTVINNYDLAAQGFTLPANLKLGFTGSTGGLAAEHVIDNVHIDHLFTHELTSIAEDSTPGNGNTVAEILQDANQLEDVDGSAAQAMAITSVDNSNGTWKYSVDGGTTWQNIDDGSLGEDHALLLGSTSQVRFEPNDDYNGSSTFSFRAWDQSAGSVGSYGDATTTGGSSAFSSESATASITVTSVNDAPTIEGDIYGSSSDSSPETTYTFDSSNYGLTQSNFTHNTTGGGHIYANNFDNNSSLTFSTPTYIQSFDINPLPWQGFVYGTMPSNQSITIEAYNGATEVWSSTVDLSSNFDWNNWATVSVGVGNITELRVIANTGGPSNLRPSIDNLVTGGETPDGLTIQEDNSHTFSAADFGFNDVDGDSLDYVKITQLPAAGSLTLNGAAVTVDQQISAADISNLVFTPAANAHGDGYANIQFKVSDGTAESAAETLSFNVTSVDDAPTTAADTVTLDENDSHTFSLSDFSFSDADGDSLSSIKITQLPAAGSLTLNGSAVTANQVITAAEIPNLVFTPDANTDGANYANFTFTVSDGSLESAPATMTFNVDNVNSAPTVDLGFTETWDFNAGGTENLTLSNGTLGTTFSGSDGNALQFGGAGERSVTTASFDTSGGGTLSFSLIYGDGSNGGELVDAGDEVSLQYSTDNGATWVTHTTYSLTQYPPGSWNSVNETLSGDLQSSNVQFRLIQSNNHAGTGYDEWAIDNLSIDTVSNSISLNEDDSHTFNASDFGYSDADGDALHSVTITQLPAAGALALNGVAVTVNQQISAADIPNLVFTPAANANGDNYANIQFKVSDGTAESAAETLNFNLTAVDDAPTATPMSLVTAESEAYVFTADDFGFNDADGDSLHSVTIKSLPVNGSLTYDGVAVYVNQVIAAADISKLQFTAPSVTADTNTSFAFTVSDGTHSSTQQNFNVTTQDAATQSDNLVTNAGATDGTNGWTVISGHGKDWSVSSTESHDGDGSSWTTSHNTSVKHQTIDLLSNGFSADYLDTAPEIAVSDWYKMVLDYGNDDTYYLKVELRAADGSVIDSFDSGVLTATTDWLEAGTTFSNYGSGVRSIYIEHGGDDGENWAGQYGTYIDDTSVRIGNEYIAVDGTSGNEILNGTAQADHLSGLGGNDVLIGGDGDDLLTGGTGADIFRFNSGDEGTSSAPATDTIEDFSTADGDVLDLSDMLVGESAATIDSFLDLAFVNGNTEISVKDSANGQTVQKIVLDGVDLSSLGSEADILNSLLNNGNLDIDQ